MTATTALTAQDTKGVYDIHYVPSAFVARQIKLCFDDIGVDVIKTGKLPRSEVFVHESDFSIGMLASADTVKAVVAVLKDAGRVPLVVDPVRQTGRV